MDNTSTMDRDLLEATVRELDRRLAAAMRVVRASETMRDAQQRYFASRSRADLSVAKEWEAKVDRYIREVPHAR